MISFLFTAYKNKGKSKVSLASSNSYLENSGFNLLRNRNQNETTIILPGDPWRTTITIISRWPTHTPLPYSVLESTIRLNSLRIGAFKVCKQQWTLSPFQYWKAQVVLRIGAFTVCKQQWTGGSARATQIRCSCPNHLAMIVRATPETHFSQQIGSFKTLFHIFQFFTVWNGLRIINPFSWKVNAIYSEKKLPYFLLTYTEVRTAEFQFPPAESWLVNSNVRRVSHVQRTWVGGGGGAFHPQDFVRPFPFLHHTLILIYSTVTAIT